MNDLNAKRREYPLAEQECYFSPVAMFDMIRLNEAFFLFNEKIPNATAEQFFKYLCHLEEDVPIIKQRCNINFFHKID